MKTIPCILVLSFCLCGSGCGTFYNNWCSKDKPFDNLPLTAGGGAPYGGVIISAGLATSGFYSAATGKSLTAEDSEVSDTVGMRAFCLLGGVWFLGVDLPLSFVCDTLLLPAAVPSEDEIEVESEVEPETGSERPAKICSLLFNTSRYVSEPHTENDSEQTPSTTLTD